MNAFSRKDFLRLTSLTLLSSLLPIQKINALSYILDLNKNISQDDFQKAVKLAKEAKVYFYKRQYKQAEEIYKQCITLAPKAIRFYDGLENVFGAQGKFLEPVILYKNGLTINTESVAFYDRLARALMRIETGNRKAAKKYKAEFNSNSMLNDALVLYNKAISLDHNKKYLSIAKKKVENKITLNAAEIDFRKATAYKKEKKKKAKQIKDSSIQLPIETLITQYNSFDTKKRTELYNRQDQLRRGKDILKAKKKNCAIIFDQYYKIKDYDNAETWAVKMFDLDKGDQQALVRIKRILFKKKKYRELINLRLEYAKKKENAFSYLGVLETIEIAHQKNQTDSSHIALAHEIGVDLLKNWGLMEVVAIDVIVKYNKILILDNQFETAFKITESALSKIETSSEERINTILYSYALLFKSRGQYNQAIDILKTALKEEAETSNSSFKYDLVKKLADRKLDISFKTDRSLYCLLYNCYKDLGKQELANQVLEKFKINNPKDSFLNKKI